MSESLTSNTAPSSSHKQAPVAVDVVSDVVCPWCFIGKSRLEKALALNPAIPVEVRYRTYFLNPWVPREGMSRADYLTTKFGSVESYNSNVPRMQAAAESEGLTYDAAKISRQPNTIDCHRLIHWADKIGKQAAMKQLLMDLYFTKGADLSDRDVLVQAAADCGLDAGEVRRKLATDEDVSFVEQEAEQARAAGIEGVPCFIIGGKYAVSGAQAPETLAQAIAQVAEGQQQRAAG